MSDFENENNGERAKKILQRVWWGKLFEEVNRLFQLKLIGCSERSTYVRLLLENFANFNLK